MPDNDTITEQSATSLTALIVNRRTIHDFIPDRVPDPERVRTALEAACWAPNHHLTTPWRFYFPGAGAVEKICQLYAEASTGNPRAARIRLARWRAMPAWLIVSCVRSEDARRAREDYAACCCLVQNLMLLLWEQGIGMKWSTNDIIRTDAFFDILGASARAEEVVGLFWYGYPATIPTGRRERAADCIRVLS